MSKDGSDEAKLALRVEIPPVKQPTLGGPVVVTSLPPIPRPPVIIPPPARGKPKVPEVQMDEEDAESIIPLELPKPPPPETSGTDRLRLDSDKLKELDRALASEAGPRRKRGMSIFDEIDEPAPTPPSEAPSAAELRLAGDGLDVPPDDLVVPIAPISPEPAPPVIGGSTVAPRASSPSDADETPPPVERSIASHPVVRRLGSYEILRSIGVGGMAEVFLARKGGAGGFEKHVALKCILPHLASQDHFVTMFLDEARLAARISDPRVAQIYELGETDGTHFIAMEYLAGEDLNTLIRRPILPPHLAARIVAEVAGGLHAAHELRDAKGQLLEVVHRDVSPGNIIVLFSGAVKVLDFGVAKARTSPSVAGERYGKYGYMSPEQIRGEDLDRRSDVFSLGVVLWEALTRQRLFAADDEQATMKRVLVGDPPAPSAMGAAVPVELDDIVLRALAKDRRARYQSAEEMGTALELYLHRAALPTSATDVAAFMRASFSDRIDAKTPGRVTKEGEPLPMADLRPTQMTPTEGVRPPVQAGSKKWLIAGALLVPVLIAGAFAVGRGSGGAAGSGSATQPIAAAPADASAGFATLPERSLVDAKLASGEIAIDNGRIASPPGDNALELILEVEEIEPANARAKELRGRAIARLLADADALWLANRKDSARLIYDDVLLFEPDNAIAKRRAGAGDRVVPKSKAEVAIVRSNTDEVPWLVSQIELAIIERRFIAPPGRNALEYLQRLRKLDPKNLAGMKLGGEVEKALIGQATGKTDEEKVKLLAAAQQAHEPAGSGSAPGPDKAERQRDAKLAAELVAKGNAALGAGQLAEARRSFEKAIVADSQAHAGLAGLAEVAYNESDYTRAVLVIKRAVALAPTVVSYRMSLAKSYYKMLRYQDAIAQWKKVIEIAPAAATAASAQKNIEMAERKMGNL